MKLWTLIGLGIANLGFTAFALFFYNKKQKELVSIMGNQEQRLQEANAKNQAALGEIKTGVDEIKTQNKSVLEQLAELKSNNPDIEDEVAAIEETANQTQAVAESLKVPVVTGDGETSGETSGETLPGQNPVDESLAGASPASTEGEG